MFKFYIGKDLFGQAANFVLWELRFYRLALTSSEITLNLCRLDNWWWSRAGCLEICETGYLYNNTCDTSKLPPSNDNVWKMEFEFNTEDSDDP